MTASGHNVIPCQWAGNPWDADVLVLMMNPSLGGDIDAFYSRPGVPELVGTCARGDWHPEYPNVWLHPTVRAGNNWHSSVVWTRIHSELTKRGVKSEAAWKRIATRGCVLELAAWPTPT